MNADRPDRNGTAELSAPASRTSLHPLDWAAQACAGGDVLAEMDRRLARSRRRRRSLLGVSVAVVVVVALLWRPDSSGGDEQTLRFASPVVVTAPERLTLGDGSVVDLKPGAVIDPQFSNETRRVVLRRGEAHFEVVKDASRPFVVMAAGVEVRAVGTAFAVQLGPNSMEVVVTEGQVAVEKAEIPGRSVRAVTAVAATGRPAAGPDTLALVEAGARIVVAFDASVSTSVARVEPMSPAVLADRLAWRVPLIELAATPLREALRLFNRHTAHRLVLGDARLGDVRLSGVLRADNVEALLRLLQEEHGIVAVRHEGPEIYLTPAR